MHAACRFRREDFPISRSSASIVGTRDRDSRAPAEAQQGRTSAGRRRHPRRRARGRGARHGSGHDIGHHACRADACGGTRGAGRSPSPASPTSPSSPRPRLARRSRSGRSPRSARCRCGRSCTSARSRRPTERIAGPLGDGARLYTGCSSCHGSSGEGVSGLGYQFSQGEVLKTFPHIEDQLRWVYAGTDAYFTAGVESYGDPNRAGGAHITKARGIMPRPGRAVDRRPDPRRRVPRAVHARRRRSGRCQRGRSSRTGAPRIHRRGPRWRRARPRSTTSTPMSRVRSRWARSLKAGSSAGN